MGCGTRIDSYDQHRLADKLEREGEYNLAIAVRRGECLDSWELRRAEDALERQGMQRNWDYRENNCQCETESESY